MLMMMIRGRNTVSFLSTTHHSFSISLATAVVTLAVTREPEKIPLVLFSLFFLSPFFCYNKRSKFISQYCIIFVALLIC